MPKAFDASNPPFDRLGPQEIERLRAGLDILYVRPGETVIAQGAASESLFVVIKGTVEERDGEELVALLGPKDSFDTRALVHGAAGHAFVAREETLAYAIPKALTLDLIQKNARFASFFYLDLSRKLDAVAREEEESRVGSLMRARVSDIVMQPAEAILASDTIETAGHRMRAINSNALYVRDGERLGIVTGMNLSKAVILRRLPLETPVGDLAHWDLVRLAPDDFVFEALLLMTKHNKRRIAVMQGATPVGIVEDIDLLSFIAGNAQLVAGRIDRAHTLDDLAVAAGEIEQQVRILRRQGIKIDVICEIVSDLNRRLLARLFGMVAPASIQERGCLIVMGSEGRGEQTLRTDQDNGLILAAPVPPEDLEAFRRDFSGALERFGFPPCPGGVMVSNPAWSRTLADYEEEFGGWLATADEKVHLDVAIFVDAEAVAGDPALLARARDALLGRVRGEQAYLARFAKAVEQFPTPIGLFNNLITAEGQGDALDLKKGGLFPIVHGARALALEKGVLATATAARIEALAKIGVLRRDFAAELVEAFRFLMTLRLDAQLAQGARGGTLVRPAALSSMERDLLRDAFGRVKDFREILRRHFNLGMF
ncbi:MAG: putative nucleotidyltransferase substrate binding domain-containing protein [Alsobacter sp.]